MAVHESQESWERFRDNILMPRLQEGIEGGFTSEPQETAFEVHNLPARVPTALSLVLYSFVCRAARADSRRLSGWAVARLL